MICLFPKCVNGCIGHAATTYPARPTNLTILGGNAPGAGRAPSDSDVFMLGAAVKRQRTEKHGHNID